MADNLVGSRISLISKKDIRYEGILYAIDKESASLTLHGVKSHGTEGRGEGEQIAPGTEVHDFISFRGQDIKDLHVHETADARQQEEQQQQHTPQPPSQPSKATPPPAPVQQQKQQQKQQQQQQPPPQQQQQPHKASGRYQPPHKNPSKPQHSNTGNVAAGTGGGRGGALPGAGNHLAARKTRGGTGMDVEEGDFDFQAALANFDKAAEKNKFTSTGGDEPVANSNGQSGDNGAAANASSDISPFPARAQYNAKTSFFDEISCDALDGRSRNARGTERALNTETFGATSVAYNRNYNRRGRGRGGRGGSGGRGGRSNENWRKSNATTSSSNPSN